jgi:hypothetical protein
MQGIAFSQRAIIQLRARGYYMNFVKTKRKRGIEDGNNRMEQTNDDNIETIRTAIIRNVTTPP